MTRAVVVLLVLASPAFADDPPPAPTATPAPDPDAAKKVVRVGESKPKGVASDVETAAWTMICNLVLNLDEVVTRN